AGTLPVVKNAGDEPVVYGSAVLISAKPCSPVCGKVLVLGGAAAQIYSPNTSTPAPRPLENPAGRGNSRNRFLPAGIALAGAMVVFAMIKRRRNSA
ncbi:MAG: hypothetical protein ACRDIA_04455, partial [Actinomycetota bacterium]